MSYDTFRQRWDRAAELLRLEHSLDGFHKMHEDGEVSAVEIFRLAHLHWYDHPESRQSFLSGLANHQSAFMQALAGELSYFIEKLCQTERMSALIAKLSRTEKKRPAQ